MKTNKDFEARNDLQAFIQEAYTIFFLAQVFDLEALNYRQPVKLAVRISSLTRMHYWEVVLTFSQLSQLQLTLIKSECQMLT